MFTSISIGEKFKEEMIEEGYYVTINYMYGDADGYVDRKWGPFYKGEEKSLLDFVNMLEKALKAFPYGKSGLDEYADKVPEFKNWLEGYDENFSHQCKDCNRKCKKCTIPQMRIDFQLEKIPDGYYSEAIIISYNVQYYNKTDNAFYICNLS